MPSQNEQIVKKYFDQDSEHLWKCKCGKKLTQKKGTGWTNLMNHIKSQHPEYSTIQETEQQSFSSFLASIPSTSSCVGLSSLNVYSWIEWVCVGLKPFSFCEDALTRKYTNLGSTTNATLKKYTEKLTRAVEKKISNELPDNFLLAIDGWTDGYVGLFASYPYNNGKGFRIVLLAFTPSESGETAPDHVEFIEHVLSLFNKNLENVVAITGDNAEVNQSIANLCGIPLIVCASHRFNLAVSAYLDRNEILLDKINVLMGKLKSSRQAGRLRKQTPLQPIQRNKKRWSSAYDMIKRYNELGSILESFRDDPKLGDYLLTPLDNTDVQTLEDHLKNLYSVTIALQGEGLDLCDVRVLFDEVLTSYPHDEFQTYLSPSSAVVHCPHFENGVVKILRGKEIDLFPNEAASLNKLKVAVEADISHSPKTQTREYDDFASACLKKRKMSQMSAQLYTDCRFLSPTSNILERFCDLRQHPFPMNLEMQLFLKINRRFWDETVVSEICNQYVSIFES